MKIPSRSKCLKMLKERSIFDNILQHTLIVNKVAVHLARQLKSAGADVNVELIDRASLLHDIAKTAEITRGISMVWHSEEGGRWLEIDYPEVANLVRKHALPRVQECKTWEEKIVQYADLRVLHGKTVSLDKRFEDLKKRYGAKNKGAVEEVEKLAPFVYTIEKEIFNVIDADIELSKLK